MTVLQQAFFAHISSTGLVVPCTARDLAGLNRMRIKFNGGHAIVSLGVIVRKDGTLEPHWADQTRESARSAHITLLHLHAGIEQTISNMGLNIRLALRAEPGIGDLFLEMKHREADLNEMIRLETVLSTLVPEGWSVTRNENTMMVVPSYYLSKAKAVRFYLDHLAGPYSFSIGMGDSFTDVAFFGECDYSLIPNQLGQGHTQVFHGLKSLATDSQFIAS